MGRKSTRNALTYETLPELFTGICDAIREKDGTSADINHQDIPTRISAIPTGGNDIVYANSATTGDVSESFTIGENGTLTVCALMSWRSANITLTKNGDAVSATYSVPAQGGNTAITFYWRLSVSANDAIVISSGSGGSSSNKCYCMAINTKS